MKDIQKKINDLLEAGVDVKQVYRAFVPEFDKRIDNGTKPISFKELSVDEAHEMYCSEKVRG